MANKLCLAFLLACAVFFGSCEIVEDALPDITFDVNGSELEFTLPRADEAGTYTSVFETTASDIQQSLDDENVSDDRVESVNIKEADFRIITANPTVDLSAIDRITLTVSSPGLGTLTLADSDLSNVNGTETTLTVAESDVKEQLLASMATYTLTVELSSPAEQELDVIIAPMYSVAARPL